MPSPYKSRHMDVVNSIEIDFLGVETNKSGDAITLRYPDPLTGIFKVHVIDGGYIETGEKIVSHIEKNYATKRVDHVVLTHPDRDHANGLRAVLENCEVGTLWMNRPWLYADELIDRFSTYNSVEHLRRKLREIYSASATLEDIALEKGIHICEAFQGANIGIFTVLTPSKTRYLDLVVESEKTPEAEHTFAESLEGIFRSVARAAANLVKSAWGDEYFPPTGTSSENEMSVVQFTTANQKKILLTGDTGRDGLTEAADFLVSMGYTLPGVNLFQVPHHGGRHNVSTAVLNRWLGEIADTMPENTNWSAVCSSAKADEDHPRKSVIRAMLHRGAHFAATEGRDLLWTEGTQREGYSSIPQISYPAEQEQ